MCLSPTPNNLHPQGEISPLVSASAGPRKCISIDTVRVSVEEALHDDWDPIAQGRNGQGGGERGGKRRYRGWFHFEADDVNMLQVKVFLEGFAAATQSSST